MPKHYVDNLKSSFENQSYINESINRNVINNILNKKIKVRDYSVNENINRNRYTGYNCETNGKNGDFIYESPSVKVINYDKGLNYNKNRLIQSVSVEEKDIGGYYIQQQDIPIVEYKSVSRKIKGIL